MSETGSESGLYDDVRGDDWMDIAQLKDFCQNLDTELTRQKQRYGLDDGEDELRLYAVGGAQTMSHHVEMEERVANDLDYMVSHTNHHQDRRSFTEGLAIQDALNNLGFEFTTGPEDRSYDPRTEACQTMANVDGSKNGMPVTNLDLIAGEQPLGKYPISWVEEYSEPISDNRGILGLEATAVRKIFRNTVDYQGQEDAKQEFDIAEIRGYISGTPDGEVFDKEVFRDAWEELLEANPDKEKPASEALGILMGRR